MEVLMENLSEQELMSLDNVQLKIEQKVAMPASASKIVGVSCQLLGQKTELVENEIVLTGSIVTRCVFINDFNKYDSEDVTEAFEKKVTVKEHTSVNQILAHSQLVNSHWKLEDDKIAIENIINVNVQGVKTHDYQLVSDLTGEVEVRKADHQILTFNSVVNDKFEITENIQLDSVCEGVLGVDVNPNLKDVVASNGKVSLKGNFAVNVLGVKTVENNSTPYNTNHEIDFAKTIAVNGLTESDLACGSIILNSVSIHIENNNQGAILVLKLEVVFNGSIYRKQKISTVADAICFSKELTLQTTQLNYVDVLPQVCATVDIENNINLAPNTPYIVHVLAVDSMRVNDLQVSVGDNKALIEGVLVVNLVLENEEHLITGERYEVPFQTHVRVDNLEHDYKVNASVVPLQVNVKARRGTELLVDAQLGIVIQAETKKSITVVNSLIEGQDKCDDGSAIRIFIIGEKEDLWSLAKRTNLSCQALLEQNPNLENGCTPGERIVVYRHENISL